MMAGAMCWLDHGKTIQIRWVISRENDVCIRMDRDQKERERQRAKLYGVYLGSYLLVYSSCPAQWDSHFPTYTNDVIHVIV